MSEGNRLVVSPNGDLVVLQRTATLKEGWHYATKADCDRAGEPTHVTEALEDIRSSPKVTPLEIAEAIDSE